MSELNAKSVAGGELTGLQQRQYDLLQRAGYDLSNFGTGNISADPDSQPVVERERPAVSVVFGETAVRLTTAQDAACVPYILPKSWRMAGERREVLALARRSATERLVNDPEAGYTATELLDFLGASALKTYGKEQLHYSLKMWWRYSLTIAGQRIIVFNAGGRRYAQVNPKFSVTGQSGSPVLM